ncbi:MAG: 50S ribosomal protein L18 [archaeon]
MSIPYRRRREGRTDYNRRRKLVGSGEFRLVVRRSNKNVHLQILKYEENGDKVISSSNSRELIKIGWKGARGNTPAAYLTGLLLGRKAIKQKVKKAILDVGVHKPAAGSAFYAAVKGVADGGVEVPHSEEVIPSKERIEGQHIKNNTKTKYTKSEREKITDNFNEVKNKITKE